MMLNVGIILSVWDGRMCPTPRKDPTKYRYVVSVNCKVDSEHFVTLVEWWQCQQMCSYGAVVNVYYYKPD